MKCSDELKGTVPALVAILGLTTPDCAAESAMARAETMRQYDRLGCF